MTVTPTHAYVSENENITLKCQAQGKPAPSLSWYKGDFSTPLSNGTHYIISETISTPTGGNETIVENTLTILDAISSDAGNYSCGAKNKLTEVYLHRLVNVYCE